MAEQPPPEHDVVARHLGLAWRAFTPEPNLQDRVRARLTSSSAATMGALATGAALKPQTQASWASLPASSKLGTALIGAGLLGIGLLSGYLIRDAREPAPVRVATPLDTPSPAPLPAAQPSFAPSPVAIAHEEPAVKRTPPVKRRPRAALAEGEALSPAPAAIEPSEELALLRRAEHAVRSDNSALALALIAELEQRHPRSSLLEERRAIELLAHCSAGASDARSRARRFLREHPRSVYAGRIAEQCAESGELSASER